MSQWTFYLDGVQVAEPHGWSAAQQSIVRDWQRRSIEVQYSGEITFVRGDYTRLRNTFVESGGCGIVTFEAYAQCGDTSYRVVKANIILADCTWNISRCTVDCSLVDDGVGARIDNNSSVEISPTSPRTKNDSDLAAVAPFDLDIFNTGGVYDETRVAYDWLACLQHAVRYITDDNVTVQSDWYNALPDDERIALLSGFQLRTGNASSGEDTRLRYTFSRLFTEVAKRYNLWRYTQRLPSGAVVLRIEQEAAVYGSTTGLDFPWTDNITQTINRDQLWSGVSVGSKDAITNRDAVDPLPFLVLQGFSTEQFHFEGVCNEDKVLDLVGGWCSCTNLINRVAYGSNTQHEDDVFMIQYTESTGQATIGNYFPGANLYNEALLNINILNRYPLPSNVGQFFGPQTDNFRASTSANGSLVTITTPGITSGTLSIAPFDDDTTPPNENPGGNWNAATYRYTAPVQGFYQFRVLRQYEVTAYSWPLNLGGIVKGVVSRINAIHRDAADVVLSQQEFSERGTSFAFDPTPVGKYQHEAFFGFVMDVGDYVEFRFAFDSSQQAFGTGSLTVRDRAGSFASTQFVANGGGVLTSVDPGAARIVELEFERLVPFDRWASMTANPTQAVAVSPIEQSVYLGHAQEIIVTLGRGEGTFKILTTRDQL